MATPLVGAAEAAGDGERELLLVCGAELVLGRDAEGLRLAERLVGRARARGGIGWLPSLLFTLAEPQLCHGLHRDAAASATEGRTIAEDTGQRHWIGQLTSVLAYLAAVDGDEARCRDLAGPVLAADHDPGAARAEWALGLLDLGLGRPGAALARLAPLAGGPAGYGVSATRCVPDLVEAAVRVGEQARAAVPMARFATWAARVRQPWADALALRCHALLGADDAAEDRFVAALARHERDRRPFERARTELLYGEWLRRGRRKTEASTHLLAAREVFERLGATPWAARAGGELGATGVAGVAGVAGPPGLLTPQELHIVRLAARGLSNRDIAAQLFLSPRTVGYHLYKAYPKLGVLSRTELPGLALDG